MTAVDLALDLVRLDTVNPPGGEEAAASLLGERLSAAGFDVASWEHAPGRPSLVARWGEEPALCSPVISTRCTVAPAVRTAQRSE